MKCSFIFYGSLLHDEFRSRITGALPQQVLEGYILGEIFIVSEPQREGSCHYPLVNVQSPTAKIAAKYLVYEGSHSDLKQIVEKLKKYEGALYRLTATSFYSSDEQVRLGLVFAERTPRVLDKAIRIENICCGSQIFDWRQYIAQSS